MSIQPVDHAAFGQNRPNAEIVIDSNGAERDSREKPVSTFSQRALGANAPLSLRLSRGEGSSFIVTEAQGRVGGVFGDLSSAMRFARLEAMARGRALDLRFDESLALIRAAS